MENSIIKKYASLYCCGCAIADKWGWKITQIFARLLIFKVFFYAGLTKLKDWESTLFLFELEYDIPLLPHTLAAVMATSAELIFPILIILGLFSRLSALSLFGMTMVIEFILGTANPAYSNIDHYFYMVVLLMIICKGAGCISLDHILAKKYCRKES